jgi:CBS domain containing-hemolysin-like protein
MRYRKWNFIAAASATTLVFILPTIVFGIVAIYTPNRITHSIMIALAVCIPIIFSIGIFTPWAAITSGIHDTFRQLVHNAGLFEKRPDRNESTDAHDEHPPPYEMSTQYSGMHEDTPPPPPYQVTVGDEYHPTN